MIAMPILWTWLWQMTAVLAAALVLQSTLWRFPATRHAVLLWAIAICGVIPLFIELAHFQIIRPRAALPPAWVSPTFFEFDSRSSSSAPALASGGAMAEPARNWPLVPILLGAWGIGTIAMLLRIVWGLCIIARIRRGASPMRERPLDDIKARLEQLLGRPVPKILSSDRVLTPVAIGFIWPVVVFPRDVLDQLDESQLLHVLLHECAHAGRRDPLVGLYERVLVAIFWFHPLVHWANRQLDWVREELCDNYVLIAAAPADYARTLVSIAERLSDSPDRLLAPQLLISASDLKRRIASLLNRRKSVMTRLNRSTSALIGFVFIAAAVCLTCLGAAPPSTQSTMIVLPPGGQLLTGQTSGQAVASTQPATIQGTMVLMGINDDGKTVSADHSILIPEAPAFPHVVKFEAGATKLPKGDSIIITEVRGTADTMMPGNIYLIKGAYILASHDRAMLAAFTTAANAAEGTGPYLKVQTMIVNKGDGSFALYLPMSVKGWPHVSFYPVPGDKGDSRLYGGTYFGTGEFVLKKWWGSADEPAR